MFIYLNRNILQKKNTASKELNCSVWYFVFNGGSQTAQKVVNFVNERRITRYTKLCAS